MCADFFIVCRSFGKASLLTYRLRSFALRVKRACKYLKLEQSSRVRVFQILLLDFHLPQEAMSRKCGVSHKGEYFRQVLPFSIAA